MCALRAYVLHRDVQALSDASEQVHVSVIDSHGIGSGASGAAAGLLHPFTPRGGISWMGTEGFAATSRLAAAAEAALERAQAAHNHAALSEQRHCQAAQAIPEHDQPAQSELDESVQAVLKQRRVAAPTTASHTLGGAEAVAAATSVVRRRGILRIGAQARQTWQLVTMLESAAAAGHDTCGAVPVTAAEARELVPGLADESLAEAVTWGPPGQRETAAVQALRARGAPPSGLAARTS